MTALSVKSGTEQLIELTRQVALNAKSINTKRAYKSDWKDFKTFCSNHKLSPLPATSQTLCFYVTWLSATKKLSTIRRRIASITEAHNFVNLPNPADSMVKSVLKGLARSCKTKSIRKKAISIDNLKAFFSPKLQVDIRIIRDRALILLGFAGGFRRSELVALDVSDIEFTRSGMMIQVIRSKMDQEGKGQIKTIGPGTDNHLCAVTAVKLWLEKSGITKGPIFREIKKGGKIEPTRLTGQSVSLIVKKYIQGIGLDPSLFAGHSLRSGLVTAAKEAGLTTEDIMSITGHHTPAMISHYYQGGEKRKYQMSSEIGL